MGAAAAPGADPGSAWERHMRRGAWADAWAVGDGVRAARADAPCWHLPRHEQWLWDGRALDGRRVLVRCYHGLGDTLMFARFLPPLARRARSVALWAQPALLPLLATMRGAPPLLALHDGDPRDGAPGLAWDADVEVMELAHALRATPETLPPPPAFDVAPAALPAHPADAPGAGGAPLRVGVVWECGPWDRSTRSIPFPLLAPLARVPGVALYALQRGPGLAALAADPAFGADAGSDDVLAAARTVRALDLVVTVDSFPAHLAGALGVPVWTLLPHRADWRWMDGRDTSPWYPTMRLLRQPRPGDWEGAVARAAADLARLAAGRAARRA